MVDKLNTYTINRPRLKRVLGWSFVVLGFVAVIAPVVPGAPLVFVGFELLGWSLVTDRVRDFFASRTASEPVAVSPDISPEVS